MCTALVQSTIIACCLIGENAQTKSSEPLGWKLKLSYFVQNISYSSAAFCMLCFLQQLSPLYAAARTSFGAAPAGPPTALIATVMLPAADVFNKAMCLCPRELPL